jgi:hypothetical protein
MAFLTPMLALQGISQASQMGVQAYSMMNQQQLDWQSAIFDEAMAQQSENMRELNTLRDVQMQQRKADDTITKKFIESITQ